MKSKLRINCLVLAALAVGAVMAPTAQAQFTSTSAHTIVSGSQEGSNVITAGEGFGSITCSTATFSSTSSTTNDADMTLTPTYSGCKDSFGRIVDVDNSGTFTFTRTGTSGGTPIGTAHFSGEIKFTITVAGHAICIMSLKGAFSTNGITYHTTATGRKLTIALTGLRSTTEGSFFNCGIPEGEHKEGTYNGTVNFTGVNTAGSAVTISVD